MYVRFTDRTRYTRFRFLRQLRGLSSLVVKEGMMGGMVTETGDYYLRTPDGLFLYYNFQDPGISVGDGQSLDIGPSYVIGYAEAFLLGYLKPGMVYLDVGANNGYWYSMKIAKRLPECHVFAFEPDPRILVHLRNNVAFNKLANAQVVAQALSDFRGVARLAVEMGGRSHLVAGGPAVAAIAVECNTLDGFVRENDIERIDAIKVDIEGGEYSFVKGATDSIMTFEPVMILEMTDALLKRSSSSVSQVAALLRELGYGCYRILGTNDGLCIPKAKLQLVGQIAWEQLAEIG